ncbi:MAG TPA: SDR family oxidoreductase [Beijerinckiaceae bacterium]|nr:SDR family oxidoreductase [Beijerinckiaceae bacterium]
MAVRLKPVENQVIVITGASSGIGLATARLAAERGARLVLVARNEEALREIARDCERRGGRAIPVAADASNREDLERVARVAQETFGGFDSWINNAAVAIYGRVDEVPIEDQRRLFDVNYWGVVYGSLIAAEHLKRRRGGAIINTGSVLSDRSLIVQGPYSASKHAVKAFTDALRMELEEEGAPISVTLIKPSAIDTPYMEHARNYLDSAGNNNPPPTYDPHLVARAMLHACEHPKRDIVVGFGGWAIALFGNLFPRLTDFVMEKTMVRAQKSDVPPRPGRRDNLYQPRSDADERSPHTTTHRKTSLLLEAQLHPAAAAFVTLAGAGLALAYLFGGRGRRRSERPDHAERGMPTPYRVRPKRVGNGESHRPVGPGQFPTAKGPGHRSSTLARH